MNNKTLWLFSISLLAFTSACPGTEEVNCTENPDEPACQEACTGDPTLSHCGDAGLPDAMVDASDAGPDVDGSNCATACDGETPVCDEEDSMECVQCLAPTDCEGVADRPMCESNSCVQCANSTQCETATASLCGEGGLCEACGTNEDCAGVTDGDGNTLGACDTSGDAGVCVGCTEVTAEDDCGLNSCNPATQLCTDTPRGDVGECGACVSDAECSTADFACVPMEFQGAARPGGYCLKLLSTSCNETSAYRTPTLMRASLSSATAAVYCGVNEALTTCEAIADLRADKVCAEDDECGAEDAEGDGRCESVNGTANRCTVGCAAGNQCPSGFMCPDSTYCGSPA